MGKRLGPWLLLCIPLAVSCGKKKHRGDDEPRVPWTHATDVELDVSALGDAPRAQRAFALRDGKIRIVLDEKIRKDAPIDHFDGIPPTQRENHFEYGFLVKGVEDGKAVALQPFAPERPASSRYDEDKRITIWSDGEVQGLDSITLLDLQQLLRWAFEPMPVFPAAPIGKGAHWTSRPAGHSGSVHLGLPTKTTETLELLAADDRSARVKVVAKTTLATRLPYDHGSAPDSYTDAHEETRSGELAISWGAAVPVATGKKKLVRAIATRGRPGGMEWTDFEEQESNVTVGWDGSDTLRIGIETLDRSRHYMSGQRGPRVHMGEVRFEANGPGRVHDPTNLFAMLTDDWTECFRKTASGGAAEGHLFVRFELKKGRVVGVKPESGHGLPDDVVACGVGKLDGFTHKELYRGAAHGIAELWFTKR